MEEPLLEAHNQAEMCPLHLSCLFPSPKMSLIEKCSFSLLTALEMPTASKSSCNSMHFTKTPPCSSCMTSHSHCQPTTTGEVYLGSDRFLCCSLALLLCRGPDSETFFCTADAVFGHIWSANGSVWPLALGWGHLACRGLLSGR